MQSLAVDLTTCVPYIPSNGIGEEPASLGISFK